MLKGSMQPTWYSFFSKYELFLMLPSEIMNLADPDFFLCFPNCAFFKTLIKLKMPTRSRDRALNRPRPLPFPFTNLTIIPSCTIWATAREQCKPWINRYIEGKKHFEDQAVYIVHRTDVWRHSLEVKFQWKSWLLFCDSSGANCRQPTFNKHKTKFVSN
jgi:hypothetical protein